LIKKTVKCVKLLSTLVGARGMLLEPEFQRDQASKIFAFYVHFGLHSNI